MCVEVVGVKFLRVLLSGSGACGSGACGSEASKSDLWEKSLCE